MPDKFVNDPSVEIGDLPERSQIVQMMLAEHGQDAIDKINQLQAQALTSFAIYGRSYVQAILNPEKQAAAEAPESKGFFDTLFALLSQQ